MAEPSAKQESLGSKMFRESALNKMSSAEDLDRYLQVTNPSAWVLLAAVAVLLIAAVIWGFTATLPVKTSTIGVLKDGEITFFLPYDGGVSATEFSEVTAAGYSAKIKSININPHSRREVEATIGSDYTYDNLTLTDWSYKIIIDLPVEISDWVDGDDVPIVVTTEQVSPIKYLFGAADETAVQSAKANDSTAQASSAQATSSQVNGA